MSDAGPFTILDVETTGLFPQCHDRIVEIGMLKINASGDVLGEYESLVNPERDVGPTSIHGITSREAVRAPIFSDIAADIVDFLKDSIVVAHNARFDLNFIKNDFSRIGVAIPRFPAVCTMMLALKVDPQAGCRKLGALCQHFGVTIIRQHSAMDDARAAAGLFLKCLSRLTERGESLDSYYFSVNEIDELASWPCLIKKKDPYPRNRAICEIANDPSYIAQLIDRLPSHAESYEIQSYYEMLDRILEDRRITLKEQDELYELAMDLGLSRDSIIHAHKEYLEELVRLALEDGIISDTENKDIDNVRYLLSISDDDFCQILEDLEKNSASASTMKPKICQTDIAGMSVCFTGQLQCSYQGKEISRAMAQEFATSRGMIVSPSVTHKVDFLVCADPDSMSGKAKKARQYGTRILADPVFWKMLGVAVD